MRLALPAALLSVLLPAAAAAGPTKVAVTDVKSVQGVTPGTATILTDIVVSEVARAGFDVISQADISSMVGFEKQKQLLGCSEETNCLAEIGGALGVDYMLTGQVGQIGSRYRISLLVVATKRARVLARAALFSDHDEDDLARAAEKTVGQLISAIRAHEAQGTAAARPPPPAAAVKPPPEVAAPAETAARPPPSLAPAPPPATPLAPEPPAEPGPAGARAHGGKLAWITLGSGGALILGGVVTGLVAKAANDDIEAQQGERGFYTYYLDNESRVNTLAVTADVLTGVGVAAVGVGAWLWWRGPGDAVAILPTATDESVGLVAAGRF